MPGTDNWNEQDRNRLFLVHCTEAATVEAARGSIQSPTSHASGSSGELAAFGTLVLRKLSSFHRPSFFTWIAR